MKKFILKVLNFLILPMFALLILVELVLHLTPGTFNKKAEYLKKNKEKIEVLFFGSSHTQDGINPRHLNLNSSNLGYGSQDYEIDYNLLEMYIDQLPKLKYIIQEVDMIDLYKNREEDYFRYPWYQKYYGIKLGSYPAYKSWSLYLSNPEFFNLYLMAYSFLDEDINEFGYNEVEVKGEFFKLNYNETEIFNNVKNVLPEYKVLNDSLKISLETNLYWLEKIKSLAQDRDITFIMLSYPMHSSYHKNISTYETYHFWKQYLNKAQESGEIVIDMEKSDEFKVLDFANSSHLNARGAKKLTSMMNDLILMIEDENN